MKKFRKIWDAEKNSWLFAHKDMERKAAYKLFLASFPDGKDITENGFYTQRSHIGAVRHKRPYGTTKRRPLYSEQIKKGYVRIKIAQPNVWISKSKWVYMETHPWEDFSERSNYIFLDGNTRNFSPDNIARVPLKITGLFANIGGTVQGNPEMTHLNILRAKLLSAQLDAGDKAGLTARAGHARLFIKERNRKAREYNSTPERRKLLCARQKAYIQKLKTEQPEKFMRQAEKQKAYKKEWYRRRKEERGQI